MLLVVPRFELCPFSLVNWHQGLIMLMPFLKFIACPICMQGLITSLCLSVLHADLKLIQHLIQDVFQLQVHVLCLPFLLSIKIVCYHDCPMADAKTLVIIFYTVQWLLYMCNRHTIPSIVFTIHCRCGRDVSVCAMWVEGVAVQMVEGGKREIWQSDPFWWQGIGQGLTHKKTMILLAQEDHNFGYVPLQIFRSTCLTHIYFS